MDIRLRALTDLLTLWLKIVVAVWWFHQSRGACRRSYNTSAIVPHRSRGIGSAKDIASVTFVHTDIIQYSTLTSQYR